MEVVAADKSESLRRVVRVGRWLMVRGVGVRREEEEEGGTSGTGGGREGLNGSDSESPILSLSCLSRRE